MTFIPYNDESRGSLDMPTQRQMNEIQKHHAELEFKQLEDGDGWCLRLVLDGPNKLPMATIGNTLYDAASRMLRIIVLMADDHNVVL